jgi:type II secretory pathway pseudopilin PulG
MHPKSSTVGRGWPGFAGWKPGSTRAFTLIEVMIACGIFFMATFAILALVAGTVRNARSLQRGDVDAGMAAAQIFQLLKTNRQAELSGSGDFGDTYRDYTYEFASGEYMTNGLLQVEIVVNRRGLHKPVDTLTIWVYNPDARSGPGGPTFR